MPYVGVKSLATSLALYLSTGPSALCFTMNPHLYPTDFWVSNSQVPFYFKAVVSSTIASFHLGIMRASFQPCGIDIEEREETNAQYEGDNREYETKFPFVARSCYFSKFSSHWFLRSTRSCTSHSLLFVSYNHLSSPFCVLATSISSVFVSSTIVYFWVANSYGRWDVCPSLQQVGISSVWKNHHWVSPCVHYEVPPWWVCKATRLALLLNNAFMHSDLQGEVYMEQSLGFVV